jgi:hypothetical protein
VTNKNTAGTHVPSLRAGRGGRQPSPTDLSHAESVLIEALPPTPTAGAGAGPDCECTQTFPAPVPGEGLEQPLAGHALHYVASLASKASSDRLDHPK